MSEGKIQEQDTPKVMVLEISPEEGSSVQMYTADYGNPSAEAHSSHLITSDVEVAYGTRPTFVTSKDGVIISSYYVEIIKAPDQPDLVGIRGWLHRYKDRKNKDNPTRWLNSNIAS